MCWSQDRDGERVLTEDEGPVEKNLNVRALIATDALLRILRLAVGPNQNDLESFVVFLAVVSAGSGRILRDPELLVRYADDEALPESERMGVSRRAIAESLGLPRETVRRKIAKLIEIGIVFEQDGLVKARSPVLGRAGAREFAQAMVREFERAGALLQRYPER